MTMIFSAPPLMPFDLEEWLSRQPEMAAITAAAGAATSSVVSTNATDVRDRRSSNNDGGGGGGYNGSGSTSSNASPADRARAYLLSPGFPESIAGQQGHAVLYRAACELIDGFGLDRPMALAILREFNQVKARPPEVDYQLEHKIDSAMKNHPAPSLGRLLAERPNDGRGGGNGLGSGHSYAAAFGAALTGGGVYGDGHDNRETASQQLLPLPHQTSHQTPHTNGAYPLAHNGSPNRNQFSHEFSDMGNALRLIDLHGHHIRFCKAYGDWMIYDGRRWAPDDHFQIESMAQEVPRQILAEIPPTTNDEAIKAFRKWALTSQSRERLNSLVQTARSHVAISPHHLDRNVWLFNCLNGTIDLRTGEFLPHRSGDLITKMAPVHYDPSAECPVWNQFVLEIMNDDPDMVDYLRRSIGYAITGVIRQHVFFCCYGTGSNGKTVLFKTISAVMGDYSNEIDSELLVAQGGAAQHPTGLTELEGRRLIVAEETEDNRRLAESLVKRLTGGNMIQARKMHKDFYTFHPTHHLFLATNHKPEIRGMDHGIWRRIRLIPFEVSFDPKIPGGRTPDLQLDTKLSNEHSGILNWLLQGCRDWQERGLIEPEMIRVATQGYRDEMDFLGWFMEERCVSEPDVKTVLSVLYGDYVSWCGLANTNPVSIRRFSSQLTDKGHPTKKSHSVVYKVAIRLKTDVEKQVDMSHGGEDDLPF
jgi:P4 family phage/plasmid primase-like protien